MMRILGCLVAVGALWGCTKKSAYAGPDEEMRPAAFEAWMPMGAEQAWEGAWTSRLTLQRSSGLTIASSLGAMEIVNGRARVFDGEQEHQLGFSVVAPCEAQFTQHIDDGSMKGFAYYGVQYLIDRGALLVGHGAAGYRRGKAAVVCARGVHVLDEDGTCTTWELLAHWRQRPESCVWSKDGDKDVLTIGNGDWAVEVVAEGDLLMDEQFQSYVTERHHRRAPSYAEARRGVDAQVTAGAR
jgi:hypothetical protein